MGRVNNYLLQHFSSLFSSLFFILFFITSVVFFIQIATITSVIKINFYELGLLYIYLLPSILVYTLPLTFFIALSLSLFNLSKENETIVLFTLGHNPVKITRLFGISSFILSLLLVVDILFLFPTAKQLNKNFIDYKRAEAKFNIQPTELGQKFSNWLVYIDQSENEESYSGVVMYKQNTQENHQNIITATKADILNNDGFLSLKLTKGKAFEVSDTKIEQINFNEMHINSLPDEHIRDVKGVKTYWLEAIQNEERAKDLSFLLLIALFPLATFMFAISLGIVTYRYEKNKIYSSIAVVTFGYLAPGVILIQYLQLYAVLIVFLASLVISYLFYKKKILQRY